MDLDHRSTASQSLHWPGRPRGHVKFEMQAILDVALGCGIADTVHSRHRLRVSVFGLSISQENKLLMRIPIFFL
jgi:hypothetical protein